MPSRRRLHLFHGQQSIEIVNRPFLLSLLIMAGVGAAAFAALWAYSILGKTSPEQKLQAFKKEISSGRGEIFETTLQGKPLIFLLDNCELFLVDASGETITKTKVLRAGFYFGLDVCMSQSIITKGEYLTVRLVNQAIGAGGGNTSGGDYRSKDGTAWEKKTENGWKSVDKVQ